MTYTFLEDPDGKLWCRDNRTGKIGPVEWRIPSDAGDSLADAIGGARLNGGRPPLRFEEHELKEVTG
jgi:hypothetical protein